MSERPGSPRVRSSVFAKLLGIMLVMAVSLILLVSGFFGLIVGPSVGAAADRMFEEHARVIAATSPDLTAAMGLARRLDLQIRYEGPGGVWATAPDGPSIDAVRRRRARAWGRPAYGHTQYVVSAPDGGAYLFSWEFGRRIWDAHHKLLWLLLGLMVGVVFAAHVVLRRALRPLRSLHDGVARLSEGDLEVVLPSRTRDEFGDLTDAFNRMAQRVRDMVRARDQLLLDVSHELRSPLTRIKVALALSSDGEKKARMAADVAEMEAMITELLELERLRDGPGIRTRREDLVAMLRAVAQEFPGHPGIRVGTSAPEIPLEIDAERVRSVLRNLLENAVKYSLPDSRPIEVSTLADGEWVVVRVTDDGPGIPEEDIGRVFEPFFRVDRSRSKRSGGYGLGLSICRRIMQAHGGDVSAANNSGRGARFTLTFPRSH